VNASAERALAPQRRRAVTFGPVNRIRALTLACAWLAWEALARSGLVFEGVVPSSFTVLRSAAEQLADSAFYGHLWRSAYEIMVGFAIATLSGIAVGLAMGLSGFCGRMLHPWLNVLAPTPKIIFLPVLMILFGVEIGSKVAMAAISAFFPVVVATFDGALQVPPVLVRVAKSFKASRWHLMSKVYLPSMLPAVVTGMRLGLGVAIIGTLLAEIKLSNRGLGFLAIQRYEAFHIPDLYAVLLITFALAVLANALIGRLAARLR
jgi:NitT/TauT family transport system permease protein